MNKKLQSLILSGILSVSIIVNPIFATNNGVQVPTTTMENTEAPGDDEPSDDEILEPEPAPAPEPDRTNTESDVTEEKQEPEVIPEEVVERIGKLQISTWFIKTDAGYENIEEFEIKSIDGITINGATYTLNYTTENGFFVIDLGDQAMELNSDMNITIHYTDMEGNSYSQEVYVPSLLSVEIYDEENKLHMMELKDGMLVNYIESVEDEPTEELPEEDPEPTEDEPEEEQQPIVFDLLPSITGSQLAKALAEVDDFMIYAETIKFDVDHEGNVATNKLTAHNILGNSDRVGNLGVNTDIAIDNYNYIEQITNSSNINIRKGATVLISRNHHTIGDADNGDSYAIDGHKVGRKDEITVSYIENDKNIEGELDKLNSTSSKLSQLIPNTEIVQQGNSQKYDIKPIKNSDEFTVVKLTAAKLRESNEYYIQTEPGKNLIILVETDGSDLTINSKFWIDGVRDSWKPVSSKILWNFCSSSNSVFTGKITTTDVMMGSFLAPEADVYVGGTFNGSIFCKNFLGNSNEVHKVDFDVENEPKPPEPTPTNPEPIVPEPIEITLTPGTGDISVYGDLYYPAFALAILVVINKKNNKN